MIILAQATHGFWLLAPLMLLMLAAHMATGNTRTLPPLLFQPMQPPPKQKKKQAAPPKPRRNIPYKKIIWLSIVGILAIGTGWLCVIRSVQFDWDPEDIAELQILQYSLNDTTTRPSKTVNLLPGPEFDSVLETLPAVQPATQPREYSVGRSYVVRVKRKSDDQWSKYRLQIVQDRETANSPKLKKVFIGFMDHDSSMIKLGDYEASELGEIVDKIVMMPSPGNLAYRAKYAASDPNKYSWGVNGLTDGSWAGSSSNCFATGDTPAFPKHVTVDLTRVAKINRVIFGVPKFGSTKNVSISISKDGKTFTDVGSYKFSLRKEERTTVKFTPAEARYVRLTYVDKYDEKVDYSPNFGFTTELEVYAAGK